MFIYSANMATAGNQGSYDAIDILAQTSNFLTKEHNSN